MEVISDEIKLKIRAIEVQTSRLAVDVLAGVWHSAFKGRGMEFEEVRAFTEGDEVRDIDWNVTARMQTPYIKRFREERELSVMLLVDVSASARFGSGGILKSELIAEIGAVLAFSAIKNNDKIGLILFSDEVEKYIPPKKGVRHVLRVIRELLSFKPKGSGTNLSKALSYLGNVQPKSCICFMITDFLCSFSLQEMNVISKKHDLISIVVSDPHEFSFPKMGFVTLTDLETRKEIFYNSNDEKNAQDFELKRKKRFQDHKKLMQRVGAGFIDIRLGEPYILPLKRFFKLRRIKH